MHGIGNTKALLHLRDMLLIVPVVMLLTFGNLTTAMEDTCKRVKCEGEDWECRNLVSCDRNNGSCRVAVPTCLHKDTSRYRVPNICPKGGHPVVDLSGAEVTCGGKEDCPVGFICKGGLCCPGGMSDVELAICESLVKRNYNLPLFSTLEVCYNECQQSEDCEQEDHICCFRDCGSKCVKLDPKAQAKTEPVIVTAAELSAALNPPPPSAIPPSSSSSSALPPSPQPPVLSTAPSLSLNADDYNNNGLNAVFDKSWQYDDVGDSAFKSGNSAAIPGPRRVNSRSRPIPARPIKLKPFAKTEKHNVNNDLSTKAGNCPARPAMVICGQRACYGDADCPGHTKCCPTRCAYKCVSPEFKGTLFKDVRVDARPGITPTTHPVIQKRPRMFGTTLRNYGVDFASLESDRNSGIEKDLNANFRRQPNSKPRNGLLADYGFSPGSGTHTTSMTGSWVANKHRMDQDEAKTPGDDKNRRQHDRNDGSSGVASGNGASDSHSDAGAYENSNDLISNMVNTAFKLNVPPRPPEKARRGMLRPPDSARRAVQGERPVGGALLSNYASVFPDTARKPISRYGGKVTDAIGFTPQADIRDALHKFPGYGPRGFSRINDGLRGFDYVDPGAFGNINKNEYQDLGLEPTHYNKTTKIETALEKMTSSTNVGDSSS